MSLLWKQDFIQTKINAYEGYSKMKMNKETEQNIAQLQVLEQNLQTTLMQKQQFQAQLQILEQNLQNTMMQKQQFQAQLLEIENAIKELEGSKKEVFKIVGNLMIASEKNELKKDLENKKEMFDLRVSNLEKQEKKIKDKFEQIQADVMKQIKG